jgi:hypothetical protein
MKQMTKVGRRVPETTYLIHLEKMMKIIMMEERITRKKTVLAVNLTKIKKEMMMIIMEMEKTEEEKKMEMRMMEEIRKLLGLQLKSLSKRNQCNQHF